MRILGIESSCDETAAAIVEGRGLRQPLKVLANTVASQIAIHQRYGGVVPEVAAREHVLNMLPVLNECLRTLMPSRLDVTPANVKKYIDAIAVTAGPGLITSLMIGVETAKTLAYAWKLPLVAVHHIEGHIYANFIGPQAKINFPALILTVSGGHTLLVMMSQHGHYKIIGETRDDAAGEAYDKAAKMLGLGYPGGPIISKKAQEFFNSGRASNLSLPRPMLNSPDSDFSFSGLKTALLYTLQKDKDWKRRIPEYCFEFQNAVIDILVSKTVKAAKRCQARTVMLAGGVAANSELRRRLQEAAAASLPDISLRIPDLAYTTDNAAMIAAAGYFKARARAFTPWDKLRTDCNLKLSVWP